MQDSLNNLIRFYIEVVQYMAYEESDPCLERRSPEDLISEALSTYREMISNIKVAIKISKDLDGDTYVISMRPLIKQVKLARLEILYRTTKGHYSQDEKNAFCGIAFELGELAEQIRDRAKEKGVTLDDVINRTKGA